MGIRTGKAYTESLRDGRTIYVNGKRVTEVVTSVALPLGKRLKSLLQGIYSGLHLYEEAVLGFPLPLRERDRVRGKAVVTNLLIQTKSAVNSARVR